jgi:hypothetical protein
MIGSRLEWLRMAVHTLFKMTTDLRIHHKIGNYEQAMGGHVVKRRATYCCQEFAYCLWKAIEME